MHDRRVTLVARQPFKPDLDWNYMQARTNRVAFVDSVNSLKFALGASLDVDIERVILDRSAAAEDFLELLSVLPPAFAGDALLIRDDGSGFLSATGRGCDRVLYSLGHHDVRFYLETHDLVTARSGAIELSA
jgi:hypothetical protein